MDAYTKEVLEEVAERLCKDVSSEISQAENSQFNWENIDFVLDYTDTTETIYRDDFVTDDLGYLNEEFFDKLFQICKSVVLKCYESANSHEWPKRETKGRNFVTVIGCQFFLMDEDGDWEHQGYEFQGGEGFYVAVVLDRFHSMIGANYGEVYPFNTEDEAKEFLRKVEEEEEEDEKA